MHKGVSSALSGRISSQSGVSLSSSDHGAIHLDNREERAVKRLYARLNLLHELLIAFPDLKGNDKVENHVGVRRTCHQPKIMQARGDPARR